MSQLTTPATHTHPATAAQSPVAPRRIAILGTGGLGRTMARLLDHKSSFRLVAVCDTGGWAHNAEGIRGADLEALPPGMSVSNLQEIGQTSRDGIADLMNADLELDGLFLALPNLPNDFIPGVVRQVINSGFHGAAVDALKRTGAVELMLGLHEDLEAAGITYVTGAGATPGLLSAAAALAAQSFVEVHDVAIRFGVGIPSWESYRATIREDIGHLPGFDIEKARAMSDQEVAEELDRRNGLLELEHMEHADDIMLERAGVVSRDKVTVGGLVDTRSPKKPLSTHVKITGTTFEGRRSSHVFTLGDETSMAANVNGTALGYLNTALWLHSRQIHGLFTAADLMPRFPR
jgi:hypothetical protein